MKDRIFCWLNRLDEREVVPEEISALYIGMFEKYWIDKYSRIIR